MSDAVKVYNLRKNHIDRDTDYVELKDYLVVRSDLETLIDYVEKGVASTDEELVDKIVAKYKGIDNSNLPRANFQVTEIWNVECPRCKCEQTAPFNNDNPMNPMRHKCEDCGEYFIITYERD